jgi:hypothetical protein
LTKTTPDYGNVGQNQAQPDIDNTELAARLGSFDVTQRSGRVIYTDNCISLSGWNGNSVNPIYGTAYRPGGSFNLQAANGISPGLSRFIPRLDYGNIGLNCIAGIYTSALASHFTIEIDVAYATVVNQFQFRHNYTTKNLEIFNNSAWITIGNYPIPLLSWNSYKLVINSNVGFLAYDKLYINELEIDISQYHNQASFINNPQPQQIGLIFGVDSSPSANPSKWAISDIIFTSDEP